MNSDQDDTLLRDFVIESRETLQAVGSQLLRLEQSPHDGELQNAIYRGLHSIKGTAGFLELVPLVDLCHRTEDVFNRVRENQMLADSPVIDVLLQVVDQFSRMFGQIDTGQDLAPADQRLVARLEEFTSSRPAGVAGPSPAKDTISDDEFEALLEQLSGKPDGATGSAKSAASQQITDDEFANLLDVLHGEGKGPNSPRRSKASNASGEGTPVPGKPAEQPTPVQPGSSSSSRPQPAESPRKAPPGRRAALKTDSTIRVDTTRLDSIMNLVGELVLTRNRLNTLFQGSSDAAVVRTVGGLDQLTAELQDAVIKIRMQPAKTIFSRFPRVVRDLARNLDKQVGLNVEGEDTLLDKKLVEALADPMVHLLRNAVDHGIESPEDRQKAGKPASGEVMLTAAQHGDHVMLSIRDDGAGIDAETLRSKALDKGLINAESAAGMDHSACLQLIFLPGLSTRQEVSNISGRGVGMDVVKTRITGLGGTVEIDSSPGKGSEIRIKVPLTMAILRVLVVQQGSRRFALPVTMVEDILEYEQAQIQAGDAGPGLLVDGVVRSLYPLRDWVLPADEARIKTESPAAIIVTRQNSAFAAFTVDRVLNEEEVVIKPLGKLLRGLPGIIGSTVSGDGEIAIVLSPQDLVRVRT